MRHLLRAAFGLTAFVLVAAIVARTPIARAGTAEKLDLAGLVEHADWIVHGRVATKHCTLDARGRPQTEYSLAVLDGFLGAEANPCVFRVPGGVLPDGRGMVLAGMPSFAVGEEVLVFLSSESSTGHRIPVGLAQGKYDVVRKANSPNLLLRGASDLKVVDANQKSTEFSSGETLDWNATVRTIQDLVAKKKAALAAKRAAQGK